MSFPTVYATEALRLLPTEYARQYFVLPFEASPPSFFISAQTPPAVVSELSRNWAAPVLVPVSHESLQQELTRAYAQPMGNTSSEVYDVFDTDADLSQLVQDIPLVEDLLEASDGAPIIRMINVLLRQAQQEGASDIHIEPFEQFSIVRLRIDGSLRDVIRPPAGLHAALISRIKIMAQLDIAEKRLPQDGRIALKIGGRAIDVRVSTLPTGYGERAVLRLLDKSTGKLSLEGLGMDGAMQRRLRHLLEQPHGIVLVTGPTGSGKSTTLYAGLSTMDATHTNIMTVEDPIEYNLEGIGQTQVNSRIEMTFARALRAILRQDPDVIMIGEIRDLETAQIAVQASLTGHLVLATLHTNDAAAAITRLVDMGVESFLLASSLTGVLAQRLVRKLCNACAVTDAQGLYQAVGCSQCGGSGYSGRTGIYELLEVDSQVRQLIHDQAAEEKIRNEVIAKGMVTMREDGQRWVKTGVTTVAEVLRATRD